MPRNVVEIEPIILPGVAVGAVVLPHGAPRPLGDIRSPKTPRRRAGVRGIQTVAFLVHIWSGESRRFGRRSIWQSAQGSQLRHRTSNGAKCRTTQNAEQ